MSLKSLAMQVLERNRKGSKKETLGENQGNHEETSGKLRPYLENPAYPSLDAALRRLSKAMPKGFNFPWVERCHPDRYRHYQVKEKAQEEAYYEVGQDTCSLASFRAALDAWEKAALALFELYRKRTLQEPDWR